MEPRLKNRDLSWLSFNARVLQEAGDPRVPLYERIKFLAIFSSNLDEFFRVRVASWKRLAYLKKKTRKKLEYDPLEVLKRIKKVVEQQQEEFGRIFRHQIRRELSRNHIYLIRETEMDVRQKEFARTYFHETVRDLLQPTFLSEQKEPPFLRNRRLYFAVKLLRKIAPTTDHELVAKLEETQYAIVEIPTSRLPRFVQLPRKGDQYYLIFLDDIVRLFLPELFPQHQVVSAHEIKMTRDAELYVEDEYAGDLVEKIKKSLANRVTGTPCRFLFDQDISKKSLVLLKELYQLQDEDLVLGGRYHNFNDFFTFPNPRAPELMNPPMPPLQHRSFDAHSSVFEAVKAGDILLHYPYHSYEYVIRFLHETATDPRVVSINITLYRVANQSQVVEQLIRAAKNGKLVTAFVEIKARFDEESNLRWAEELEQAGVKVLYSFPRLKVHAKLCLITTKEGETTKEYAYLATGNFNEKTALAYTDHGLFTTDERLTRDVARVFDVLAGNSKKNRTEHLLVSPFSLREQFTKLIEHETAFAREGKEARIIIKMNSLEDPDMIEKLYKASEEGVDVFIIVRGICRLLPGVKGMSSNINVISIVDRFLEHGRIYLFHNGGQELMYLASADWMIRNLDRRIETAFPIYNAALREEMKSLLNLQLSDTYKARVIDKKRDNRYKATEGVSFVRSQTAIYEYLKMPPSRTTILD